MKEKSKPSSDHRTNKNSFSAYPGTAIAKVNNPKKPYALESTVDESCSKFGETIAPYPQDFTDSSKLILKSPVTIVFY
jgi:hypothetical protein